MHTLSVDLGERSYPIYIGQGLLQRGELFHSHIDGGSVMVVTNETVAPLYLEPLQQALGDGLRVCTTILPDGEEYKTLTVMERIITSLLEQRFDRNSTLIALGGGVIGDITGFAAACYQRGVDYIQVPTTLLAQVDSSVGGKTAVNHRFGKNMIGAFYQPLCVVADTNTLQTLEDRHLYAGLAEVIKYGLIRDAEFFQWIEAHIAELVGRRPAVLASCIERSCLNKAEIVALDERESGLRALLNLGHTFGHAIEAGMGYGEWLHGEAVAAGIYMAAYMSKQLGHLDTQTVERIEQLLKRARLPVRAPESLSPKRMLELMAVDKKVHEGALRLVLLEALGRATLVDRFDPKCLEQTLAACSSAAQPA